MSPHRAAAAALILAVSSASADVPLTDPLPAWSEIRAALGSALSRKAPNLLEKDCFLIVDPLPQSIDLANAQSGEAEKIANYVPENALLFGAGSRLVFNEYKAAVGDIAAPAFKPSSDLENALAQIYEVPGTGSLIRSKGLTLRLKPVCLDYIQTNEAILDRLGVTSAMSTSGSNYLVDGLINLGSKHRVRSALQVLAQEDVRQSSFFNAINSLTGLSSADEAESFAETRFLPDRRKWNTAAEWVAIEMDIGAAGNQKKVTMQILLPHIERTWLSWPLLERRDWSWQDSSSRYASLGLKSGETSPEQLKRSLLPAVPIALVLANLVSIEGDLSDSPELSQWISSVKGVGESHAVVIGTICRQVPFHIENRRN